jgi:glyoxylase-like metal-dependent hydrolase (beta-lactamase superfamily II)
MIERILANNPGPFTGPGTNTWILSDGSGSAVVIDPGPIDAIHAASINDAVGDSSVVAVLVTHTHEDHAPMANPLARDLGVPALGHRSGPRFDPDLRLDDGDSVDVGEIGIEVVFTPGHSDDHLCFRVGNVLFTGDHIMGGSSVMVEAMGPYLDSLRKLKGTGLETLLPGHGDEMDSPDEVIDWYIAHRIQRHRQIAEAIESGARTPMEVVEIVYAGVDQSLYPLAERSVRAHLTLLSEEGRIAYETDSIVPQPPQPHAPIQ